jgi:hypothetical protein
MSKDVRDALQIAVSKVQTPAGQANAVIRALSVLRYNKAPKVSDGKLDGDNVRIYEWGSDSPAGRFYLITGAKFLPKIVEFRSTSFVQTSCVQSEDGDDSVYTMLKA